MATRKHIQNIPLGKCAPLSPSNPNPTDPVGLRKLSHKRQNTRSTHVRTGCLSLLVLAQPLIIGGCIAFPWVTSKLARRFKPGRLPNLLIRRPLSEGVPNGVATDEVAGVADSDLLKDMDLDPVVDPLVCIVMGSRLDWGTSPRKAVTHSSRSFCVSARNTKARCCPCSICPLSANLTLFT